MDKALKLLKKIFNKKTFVPLLALFIIIGSGLGIFYYSKNSTNLNLNFNDKEIDPVEEAETIVSEVGKIYLLPDEVPTLATVSDKNQLSDQVFFQKAENGDKVLIYQTAGLAILYRPSISKIINVGPVTLNEGQIEASEHEGELSEVSVLILNGTTTVGLTAAAATELEGFEFAKILDRDDAVNKPYEKTLVIYQSEEFQPQAETIGQSFTAEVISELPDNEATNEADIVIILGEDYAAQN